MDISRLHRVLKVITLLQTARYWSPADLARDLEVSPSSASGRTVPPSEAARCRQASRGRGAGRSQAWLVSGGGSRQATVTLLSAHSWARTTWPSARQPMSLRTNSISSPTLGGPWATCRASPDVEMS